MIRECVDTLPNIWLCVCVCVFSHFVHSKYQSMDSTSKMRTFLRTEDILACSLTSKDCLEVKP